MIIIIIFTPYNRVSVQEPGSNFVPHIHYIVEYLPEKTIEINSDIFFRCVLFQERLPSVIPRWSVYQGCHVNTFKTIAINFHLLKLSVLPSPSKCTRVALLSVDLSILIPFFLHHVSIGFLFSSLIIIKELNWIVTSKLPVKNDEQI
jgi:hypothetical protein